MLTEIKLKALVRYMIGCLHELAWQLFPSVHLAIDQLWVRQTTIVIHLDGVPSIELRDSHIQVKLI